LGVEVDLPLPGVQPLGLALEPVLVDHPHVVQRLQQVGHRLPDQLLDVELVVAREHSVKPRRGRVRLRRGEHAPDGLRHRPVHGCVDERLDDVPHGLCGSALGGLVLEAVVAGRLREGPPERGRGVEVVRVVAVGDGLAQRGDLPDVGDDEQVRLVQVRADEEVARRRSEHGLEEPLPLLVPDVLTLA
ncbi:MAG: hypothetical protein ACK559_26370, partial [bacterium]